MDHLEYAISMPKIFNCKQRDGLLLQFLVIVYLRNNLFQEDIVYNPQYCTERLPFFEEHHLDCQLCPLRIEQKCLIRASI